LEVRKRVFIKLPFSRQVAEVMEAAVPIALENNTFICGLPTVKFPLSGFLIADQVKNTIEGILRQAAGHPIRFEVIDGTTLEDWQQIKQRRDRAHSAVLAMAEQNVELHHFEDVLNQVVGEIRHRVTSTRDRNFPHVRARLIL
jgi:Mg2+/Co2+ transporter CorC